jgi:hypothetical protein
LGIRIDYGDRKIKIYPDLPIAIKKFRANAGLTPPDYIEMGSAYMFIPSKT